MRALIAVIKKELLEQLRSSRLMILGIVFVLFGIMNPATAKLTPALMELFAESLESSGLYVGNVTVTALDSWTQFYKNMPMALLIFVFIECTVFTKEFQTGTLVLSLTKGLDRYKVVIAKTAVLVALWTLGFLVSFGITYGYTEYFWDNSIAKNLWIAAFFFWLYGVWIITLLVLLSILIGNSSGLLATMAVIVFGMMFAGMIPKIGEYLPQALSNGTGLVYGSVEVGTFTAPAVITGVLTLVFLGLSIPAFNRKNL